MNEFFNTLTEEAIRKKPRDAIGKYLSASPGCVLTVGIYNGGGLYVYSNSDEPLGLLYDVGSLTKTLTAHLILYLAEEGKIQLDMQASEYLDLPRGNYPTVYELLTHTSGFGYLTPVGITLPSLLRYGYTKHNPYEKCKKEQILRALSRRRRRVKREHEYAYSDFNFAVLALIAEAMTGESFSSLIESFAKEKLGMTDSFVSAPDIQRAPKPMAGARTVDFWKWNRDNPYIAGGGMVSTVSDILKLISLEVECNEEYVTKAQRVCDKSSSSKRTSLSCIGWHTYKNSNRLWSIGAAGTFRTSVIFDREKKIGVTVLGNSIGKKGARVHHIAKMLYYELKNRKIDFNKTK